MVNPNIPGEATHSLQTERTEENRPLMAPKLKAVVQGSQVNPTAKTKAPKERTGPRTKVELKAAPPAYVKTFKKIPPK